jgi:mRNA degradation ribonuclease J1/J2
MSIKITPLGGVNKVGRTSFFYQLGNTGLIIDCGTEIVRDKPDDSILTPDLDLLGHCLMDVKEVYGIFITHGHLDHFGAAGLVSKEFDFPVYLSETALDFFMLQCDNRADVWVRDRYPELTKKIRDNRNYPEREEDKKFIGREKSGYIRDYLLPENLRFKNKDKRGVLRDNKKRDTYILKEFRAHHVGNFTVTPIPFIHSIPETLGFLIEGEGKRIFHMPDCKLNGRDPVQRARMETKLREIVSEGKIDLVVMESLHASIPGESAYEKDVLTFIKTNLSKELDEGRRVFIATLSSHTERLRGLDAMTRALLDGVPPVYVGPSMVGGAKIAGLENGQKDSRVLIVTGSQAEAEEGHKSFLVKALEGIHRNYTFTKNDSVFIAFSAIPGNEKQVANMIRSLSKVVSRVYINIGEKERLGLRDCKNVFESLLHSTGHGYAGEKKAMLEILNPDELIPCHAEEADVRALEGLKPRNTSFVVLKVGFPHTL